MGGMAQEQEDIAVFWDFDSTKSQALNSELQPSEIVQNIRSSLFPYGFIKSFRAYGNFSGQALVRATNVRSDLLASGLTLMDCPNDGRKDLGVKIMLVDMVAHAWNHQTPHTFVIITADRDLAYCISTLRMRKFRVLVLYPPGSHSDLKAQATCQMDWNLSILGNTHHEDNFRNGDIFDDIRPAKKPSSSVFHTPAVPGSTASSYQHQTSQPTTGGASRPHDQERSGGVTSDLFELHDLPVRSRRNSMFSSSLRPHKFDVFGDITNEDVSPKLPRGAFGLGDGPLLPRSQSRFGTPSRPDSVPSNYMYPSVLSKPPYTPQPDKPIANGGTNGSIWKGNELSFLEPGVIAPQAPPPDNYNSLVLQDILDSPEPVKAGGAALSGAFAFSVPQKGVEAHVPTADTLKENDMEHSYPPLEPKRIVSQAPPGTSYNSFAPQRLFHHSRTMRANTGRSTTAVRPLSQARRLSTSSSTSASSCSCSTRTSRVTSSPPLDSNARGSTAPTSADADLSVDKQTVNTDQSTRRESTIEMLYQSFEFVAPVVEQPSRPADKVQEAVPNAAPERIPFPSKVEQELQTPVPQLEVPLKSEPRPASTVEKEPQTPVPQVEVPLKSEPRPTASTVEKELQTPVPQVEVPLKSEPRPASTVEKELQTPAPQVEVPLESEPRPASTVEKKPQTPAPQVEVPPKSEPRPASTVNEKASSISSKTSKPVPQQSAPVAPPKGPTKSAPKASPPPLTGEKAQFKPLVEILQANQRASSLITTKSTLGAALLKHDINVYRSQTGSSKNFKSYIAAAVAAGIIAESNNRQSVKLLPPYAL